MSKERIAIDPMRSFDPLGLHGQFDFPYFEVWPMKSETQFPSVTTHPETGEHMVLDTTQGADVLNARLTRDVGNFEGGRQALDKIREKEKLEGRIYVNPATGYRARLNPQAAEYAATGAGAMSAREHAGAGDAPNGDARAARRQELERQLAELDAQWPDR